MLSYTTVVAAFGALVLLTAWLPVVLREMPLSLPIVCIAIGAALSYLPGMPVVTLTSPLEMAVVERATEMVVIIALMGAGLKIDRAIGWRPWAVTWRLLGIAMPLTIAVLGLLASWLLGFGAAAALLLGAALAPTDPVLASDVQVGPPGEGQEDEMRFALTSEAGLNDGLAFPFVMMAILLAAGGLDAGRIAQWLAVDVAWKVGGGVAVGVIVGRGLGWLTFHLPVRSKLSRSGAGFVALGITCLAYGLAELSHTYGFLAVFVAALALRATERGHAFHVKLHDFMEELERLLMMVLLVGLGAALAAGGLLGDVTWPVAVFTVAAIFVVRPLCAWISLAGLDRDGNERRVIAFFGIRGLGTPYYLAFAFGHAVFPEQRSLWVAAAAAILLSIVLHGTTVTPVLRWLDRTSGRDTETAQLELKLKSAP